MTEVHPLIAATRLFRESVTGYINYDGRFVRGLFSTLFASIHDEKIRSELGKEVMRLQFPAVDDDTLLQMWRLALATERRQDPGAVIDAMGEFLRKQAEEKRRVVEEEARRAREQEKEDKKRSDEKEILDRHVDGLNLQLRLTKKLSESGINYIGELVRMNTEQLRELGFKQVSIEKIDQALRELDGFFRRPGHGIEWWSPPESAA